MKEIIFKYLNTNYYITIGDGYKINMIDVTDDEPSTHRIVYETVIDVFGISGDELKDIVDDWYANKLTQIHNDIVDMTYKVAALPNTNVSNDMMIDYQSTIIEMLAKKYKKKDA